MAQARLQALTGRLIDSQGAPDAPGETTP
jgi:hypothetical protein